MADIFISYSRKDSEQAAALTKRLQADGLTVWIDRHGIDGAEQWATEIVEGINGCKTFLLLLSAASIASENVLKELSLASEKGKRILPVDIGFASLPASFEYQVAGIQRVPITEYDSILRAHKRGVGHKKISDLRKSLIILPFEDLSPEKDNQWFADGLVGELIGALSNIKSLRVVDRKSSLDLRGIKQPANDIAQLFDSRYIAEGTVMKLGERIKVSVSLIDTRTHDQLWQDSFKGVMEDIFELQESVTEKIVEGLKLHLTASERESLTDRDTDNVEAYELHMRGLDYFRKATKESMETAYELLKEAIQLDPNFAFVYSELANCCTVLYRKYNRDERLLDQAEDYIRQAEELGGNQADIYWMKSQIALRRNNFHEAIRYGKLSVETDAEFALAYYNLGMIYSAQEDHENAAEVFRRYTQLRETDLAGQLNYLISLHSIGDKKRLEMASRDAMPIYERHIRFTPDDYTTRGTYALLLGWIGATDRALEEAEKLVNKQELGVSALFNLASIFEENGDLNRTAEILTLSIDRGFREVEAFNPFIEHKLPGIEQIVSLLNKKIEEEKIG